MEDWRPLHGRGMQTNHVQRVRRGLASSSFAHSRAQRATWRVCCLKLDSHALSLAAHLFVPDVSLGSSSPLCSTFLPPTDFIAMLSIHFSKTFCNGCRDATGVWKNWLSSRFLVLYFSEITKKYRTLRAACLSCDINKLCLKKINEWRLKKRKKNLIIYDPNLDLITYKLNLT